MEITTDAEADRLAEQIKKELGVDVRVYAGDAVVKNLKQLSEFLNFAMVDSYKIPMYSVFFLFLAAFVPAHLEGKLFWILGGLGIVLFFGLGMIITTLRIVRRLKSIVPEIIDHTSGTVQAILVDMKQVQSVITPENQKQKYGLLFKGVFRIITIPLITEAIAEGIPIIGGFLKKIIKSLLLIISNHMKIGEPSTKEPIEVEENNNQSNSNIENNIKMVEKIGIEIKSMSNLALKVLNIPIIIFLIGNIFTCLIYTLVIRFIQ